MSNGGDGVTIIGSRNATVGGIASGAGNQIVSNSGFGLLAAGVCTGTLVQSNMIAVNSEGNVNISRSHGVTFRP